MAGTEPGSRPLEQLFHEALERPSGERDAFLVQQCGEDQALLGQLRELLRADEADTHPGLEPPLEQGPPSLGRLLRGGDASAVPVPGDAPRYELLQRVGRGGMGEIWRARDRELARDVAIKILRPELRADASALRRFVSEARVGGQLQHPGVVPVYDLGEREGQLYLAMRLVEGRSLADLLAESSEERSERRRLLGVFQQIAQAMAFAHDCGVIHRDLKPANVMLGRFGEVQIADWGMARVVGEDGARAEDLPRVEDARSGESVPGTVLGTPGYMPPEQARGEVERLDARADVFALGAILCELLTGTPAWPGDTREALELARSADARELQARLATSDEDPALVELARQCLEPDPAARPADAREVARRIGEYLEAVERRAEASRLQAAVAVEREQAAVRVQRLGLALGASVVALLLLGGGGWWWMDRAQQRTQTAARADFDAAWGAAMQRLGDAEARGDDLAAWRQAQTAAEAVARLEDHAALDERRRQEADQLRRRIAAGTAAAKARRQQREREDRLLTRLEEIPIPPSASVLANHERRLEDFERKAREYEQAFAGFDVVVDDPEGAAAVLSDRPRLQVAAVAFHDWIDALERTGQQDRAAALRRLADLADPDPWRQRLRAADVSPRDRDVLMELRRSIRLAEQPPSTGIILAEALRNLGDSAEALQVLDETLEHHPDDFHVIVRRAMFAEDGRPPRIEEALRHYTAARALRPRNSTASFRLGVIAMQAGDMDAAAKAFAEVCRLEPDFVEAAINLSGVLVARYRSEEALEVLEPWSEVTDVPPELHANRASALLDLDRVDEALAALEHVEREKPDLPQLHTIRAGCWIEKGRLEEAREDLRASLLRRPGHGLTLTRLIEVCRELGSWDEAERAAWGLVEAYPTRPGGFLRLAELAEAQGRFEPAARHLLAASGRRPDVGMLLLAVAHFDRAGRRDEAEKTVQQVLQVAPGQPDAAWMAAHFLAERGLAMEARAALQPCREAPASVELRRRAEDLHQRLESAAEEQAWLLELARDPEDALPEELVAAADLCWRAGRREESARAYRQALDEDPSVVEERPEVAHLLQAARGLLSARDLGDEDSRARRSLDWLEFELELIRDGVREVGGEDAPGAWWDLPELAPIRDAASLRRLEPALRERCRAFWDEVAAPEASHE